MEGPSRAGRTWPFGGAGRAQSPLAPLLSSLKSSTSGKIQGLQLNASLHSVFTCEGSGHLLSPDPWALHLSCFVIMPPWHRILRYSCMMQTAQPVGNSSYSNGPECGEGCLALGLEEFYFEIKVAVEKDIITTRHFLVQLMRQVGYSQSSQAALQGDYCYPTSRMRKPRLRKVEKHGQGHTASKWQDQVLNSC